MFKGEIDRYRSNSVKWDRYAQKGLTDILPFWVADMDFPVSACITEAIIKRAQHEVYGYTDPAVTLKPGIVTWYKQSYQVDLKPENIILSTGVLDSYVRVIEELTVEGDFIIVQAPVYPPLFNLAKKLGRRVVKERIVIRDNYYEIDFKALLSCLERNKPKLFVLCSPHNPIGRVWSKSELEQIVQCCRKTKTILIIDEIHCDWVFTNRGFTSGLSYSDELADQLIILNSPVKSFNIAGLKCSFMITFNEDFQKIFTNSFKLHGVSAINTFGLEVMNEIYQNPQGKKWLADAKEYVYANYVNLREKLKQTDSKIVIYELEATFLVWLDFRAVRLDIPLENLNRLLIREAKIECHDGSDFGEEEVGFLRMNIACSRGMLDEGINRLQKFLIKHTV